MPLSWNEIRDRALAFSSERSDECSEDAEAKSFWDGFFNVFGITRRRVASFEARFLIEKVDLARAGTTVNLILDRCKNREEIKDFNSYVENQLQGLLPLDVPLFITHEFSHNNPGLQAVDLFCWGFYRKHEVCDEEWYRVYRSAIAYEGEYLK